MSKLVIGLTSGIAGGKDLVAQLFSQHGIEVVDADKVSHQLTTANSPLAEKIIEHFGKKYRREDGSIDRRALRARIFNVRRDRLWLESLLHPPIKLELIRLLQKCHGHYSLLVSPLILETAQRQLCHKIIVIQIAEELQIIRACKRDGITRKEARAILAAQMPLSEKIKQADYILDNNGTRQELNKQVSRLHHQLRLVAGKSA